MSDIVRYYFLTSQVIVKLMIRVIKGTLCVAYLNQYASKLVQSWRYHGQAQVLLNFLGHSSVDRSVFIVCTAECHVHVPLSVLQICLKTSFYFYSSRVSAKVLR